MEAIYEDICHGCLSSERKISIIKNCSLKECFFRILKKEASTIDNIIQLCFECAAILVKIKKFQEKVIISSEKLLNCCVIKTTSQSSLKINTLSPISITDDDKELKTDTEFIKTEYDHQSDLNIEENDVESSNDFDETVQIDYPRDICNEIRLSMKEIAAEREELRCGEDYVNAMFKCDRCVLTFTNVDDMDEHVNKKHVKKSKFKCVICECGFNSLPSFKYHKNRHRLRYKCNVCEKKFVYKREFIKHYNIVHCHGIENFANVDSEIVNTTPDLSEKADVFSCDVCSKQFRWKASLRKHLERHSIESGQKRKPYCEPCKLYFATTSNLRKHVRASSKHQIQLKLRNLKQTNATDSATIKEIEFKINSSRRMYPCPQCDKKFQWHGNLLRHLNNHKARASGELVCVPCNRSFSSTATYQQHMKISKKHVTEEDYKYMCSECGKRFADKTRLKDHVDWEHLKNLVHTCPECQKAFKTRASLYLHKQIVHERDLSKHLCDHCGKHFPNRSKLRVHIRAAHSSVAAYKCGTCGAKFAWHSCLSRHIRRLHKT